MTCSTSWATATFSSETNTKWHRAKSSWTNVYVQLSHLEHICPRLGIWAFGNSAEYDVERFDLRKLDILQNFMLIPWWPSKLGQIGLFSDSWRHRLSVARISVQQMCTCSFVVVLPVDNNVTHNALIKWIDKKSGWARSHQESSNSYTNKFSNLNNIICPYALTTHRNILK